MALTAVFAADFDRFESALKSASFDLQVFDRATSRAMQSLKKETEGFSGQKVAVEASRMTEAVTRLGGAGGSAAGLLKLLPAELQRVSAALDTAAAKAKLMGETLPPSLQKMREEIAKLPAATTPAVGGISSLATAFRTLGPLLGVTSLIGAATAIGRLGMAALESAGQIVDLSGSLGISTDAVQEMQAVANQTGTSIETFAAATFKLGVNVAEGTTKARDAVKGLGLEYTRLASMRPEEQFRAVIRALEDVDNVQERNRLGTALFGRQFAEIAKSVAQGYSDIADAASKTSEAQLKALDRAGDAWQKFKDDVSKSVQSMLGNLVLAIQAIETAADAMSTLEKLKLFAQSGFEAAVYLKKLKEIGEQMEANAAFAASNRPVSSHGPVAVKAATDYVAALKEINTELAKLSPTQRAQIDAALKLSGASEEMADKLGLSVEALKVYQDRARESAQHTKAFAAEQEKAAKATEKFRESIKNLTSVMAPFAAATMDAGAALHDLPSGTLEDTAKATEAARIETEAWVRANGGLSPSIQAVGSAAEDTIPTITKFGTTIKDAIGDLPKVIMGALMGGGDVGKSIGALFGANIFGPGSDLVKSMTSKLTGALGATIGGALGSIVPGLGTALGALGGDLIGKLFGGGEGKKVNDLRDQFTAAAGGIDKLAQHAMEAGISMQAFFAADTVKEYEAAIRDLDGAFKDLEANRALAGGIFDDIVKLGEEGIPDFLQPHIDQLIELGLLTEDQVAQLRQLADAGSTNWDKIRQAADKYGVRLESLGQPFNAQRIGADAASIINAFTAITNAGGDVGGVLFDMQDEISKVVQDSAKFGTTIPANMKPWIEELIRAGLLVDENGQLITDMGRIQFGDEITTEAEKTRKAFEGITEAIRELIRTINSIPAIPGMSGGGGGGGGTSYSPTEPNPAVYASSGGGGGGGTYNVNMQVDGRTVADAVIDHMGNRLSVRGAR